MKYDLARLAKLRRPRRKAIVLRPIDPTQLLMLDLFRIALAPLRIWAEGSKTILIAYSQTLDRLTRDAASDPVKEALEAIGAASDALVLTMGADLRRWAVRVQDWHASTWSSRVKEGTGVEAALFIAPGDAEDLVQAFQAWSTSLIRGVADDTRRKVETSVMNGVVNQTPRREVAREIASTLGISRKRAQLIATDQTLKLTSKLDQFRQQEAGIDQYIWRHSGKLHPREWHVEREGKIFNWEEPPYDGHPGTLVNCGCKAQAYISFD